MPGLKVSVEGRGGAIATLREIEGPEADLDFFELHPQLKSIWSGPLLDMAREGFVELGRCDGGRFAIEADGRVIGITGFYAVPEAPRCLRLRWHGLVPEARGRGISGPVMGAVCALGKARFPEVEWLIESMPAGLPGAHIARHFEALGFAPHGSPQPGGSVGFDWQEWAARVESFLPPPGPSTTRPRHKP